MEMVKTKLVPMLLCLLLLASCGDRMAWSKFDMDGSRTGVKAMVGDNVDEAFGVFEDGVYTSPSGAVFNCGSTPAVAKIMIDAQPAMAYLRQPVADVPARLYKKRPQSPLSNLAVDALMRKTAEVTHLKVDVGISNFGGIRVDEFAAGPLLLDDVKSAFPFKNYLCYVALRGREVRAMLDSLGRNRMQVLGGVKLLIEDGVVSRMEVGGAPLDDDRLYGVATLDFLLDGGDKVYVARNSEKLIITDVLLQEAVLSYIDRLTCGGVKPLVYGIDDRISIVEKNQ